jgi:RNA 2',3'-cyclic 3'-phosphodiesterase
MRAFIALDIPQQVKEEMRKICLNLQGYNKFGINWVDSPNMHITFQFLGDISGSDQAAIEDIIATHGKIITPPFFINPVLELVPPAKPRLLWLRYSNDAPIVPKAHRMICREISNLGYKLDKKKLIYHVTLGRIKQNLPSQFVEAVLRYKLPELNFSSEIITLYQSILKPQGPVYSPLFSIKL